MVHLDGTGEDEIRIAHGEAIAAMCDAHLAGVFTNLLPDYGMVAPGDAGAAAAAAMLEVEERARADGAETLKRLQQRFSRLGWREWIMGGTTREMLAASEVPILMAH
jgi:hypothetical protein